MGYAGIGVAVFGIFMGLLILIAVIRLIRMKRKVNQEEAESKRERLTPGKVIAFIVGIIIDLFP